MLMSIAKRFLGTVNDRQLRKMYNTIEQVNQLEPELKKLTDSELKAKTALFKQRFAAGETLDALLPEAFAVVREASVRTLHMRHFDVQLMGGMILHQGMIAEMKTGEGKTLVATLAVYLNALAGEGVHVVSVNDYLVKRDAAWMGKIYEFLGLTVGYIVHELDDQERRQAYNADITYGTNNEFGFDYLRDNMKFTREDMVQRKFYFAIVDEVDSILVDEARTPLIISGPSENSSDLYHRVDKIIPKLVKEDYEIDEKARSVTLTEDGTQKVESLLKEAGLLPEQDNLYDIESISLVHHVNQALKAHTIFSKDKDYLIKDSRVVIVDEFTGRMMEGRRYSDGLHQALEAKEGVPVQNENQTLASITFQNYFRLYNKLAGMTGTAMTEAAEFQDIYNLVVVEVPTHMPVVRKDEEDEIYRTVKEKHDAIIHTIEEAHKKKQPVLVGTISIEKSEVISKLLKKKHIPHHVLNAKHHEKEASIIAQAGRPGAVTIATNMAGRGTDIMLGGNPDMLVLEQLQGMQDEGKQKEKEAEIRQQVQQDKQTVLDAGGLFVIGTERHESRRIDNQLRGRSGRQGDPGRTHFYLSLEDDLMRIFGSDRISNMLQKLGLKEGEAIIHPWISKAIEKAQKKVEQHNYEIRKNLLKFDDVMNDQRKVIYDQRIELMEEKDVSETVKAMQEEVEEALVLQYIPEKSYPEAWDTEALQKEVFRVFGLHLPIVAWAREEGIAEEEILERLRKETVLLVALKEKKYGAELMRMAEKKVLLFTLDQLWKDHLLSLDYLRQGIGLRAYGQKDPLNEYKREAFYMFESMLDHLREVVIGRLSHMELTVDEHTRERLTPVSSVIRGHETRQDPAFSAVAAREEGEITHRGRVAAAERDPRDSRSWGKMARNEACPCGSGKKYKHCHGRLA